MSDDPFYNPDHLPENIKARCVYACRRTCFTPDKAYDMRHYRNKLYSVIDDLGHERYFMPFEDSPSDINYFLNDRFEVIHATPQAQ